MEGDRSKVKVKVKVKLQAQWQGQGKQYSIIITKEEAGVHSQVVVILEMEEQLPTNACKISVIES